MSTTSLLEKGPDLKISRLDSNKGVVDVAISNALKHPSRPPASTTTVVTPPLSLEQSLPPIQTPIVTTPITTPSQTPPPQATPGHFDKLTVENYDDWKEHITTVLVNGGLFGIVAGTECHPGGDEQSEKVKTFRSRQALARAEIILHISPSHLIYCFHDEPALIWNALAAANAAHKRITTNTLRRQFHKLYLNHDETMLEFIERVQNMASMLNKAGVSVKNDALIILITSGLPRTYDSFLASLDTLPESEYNLDSIVTLLVAEYQRQISTTLPSREVCSPAAANLNTLEESVVSTPYSSILA